MNYYPFELISTYPGSFFWLRLFRFAMHFHVVFDAAVDAAAAVAATVVVVAVFFVSKFVWVSPLPFPSSSSCCTSFLPPVTAVPETVFPLLLFTHRRLSRAVLPTSSESSSIRRILPQFKHFRHSVGLIRLQLVHVHCSTEAIVPIVGGQEHGHAHLFAGIHFSFFLSANGFSYSQMLITPICVIFMIAIIHSMSWLTFGQWWAPLVDIRHQLMDFCCCCCFQIIHRTKSRRNQSVSEKHTTLE